jgi:hypothetical protein
MYITNLSRAGNEVRKPRVVRHCIVCLPVLLQDILDVLVQAAMQGDWRSINCNSADDVIGVCTNPGKLGVH